MTSVNLQLIRIVTHFISYGEFCSPAWFQFTMWKDAAVRKVASEWLQQHIMHISQIYIYFYKFLLRVNKHKISHFKSSLNHLILQETNNRRVTVQHSVLLLISVACLTCVTTWIHILCLPFIAMVGYTSLLKSPAPCDHMHSEMF